MLGNNGVYPGDPQVFSIHAYTNMADEVAYHLSYSVRDEENLYCSPFCAGIVTLWDRNVGLHELGKKILGE